MLTPARIAELRRMRADRAEHRKYALALRNSADELLSAAEEGLRLRTENEKLWTFYRLVSSEVGHIRRFHELSASQAGHHENCKCKTCKSCRAEMKMIEAARAALGGTR